MPGNWIKKMETSIYSANISISSTLIWSDILHQTHFFIHAKIDQGIKQINITKEIKFLP